MYITFLHQYQLVISSRGALFDYCELLKPEDLLKPLPSFNNESIRNLMIHNANTYLSWLVNYAMHKQQNLFNEEHHKDLNSIRHVFEEINLAVDEFLHHFTDTFDLPVTQPKKEDLILTTTPLQLFTHVITHEFHHKGQILNMSRQLGYTPVDTDIIRF